MKFSRPVVNTIMFLSFRVFVQQTFSSKPESLVQCMSVPRISRAVSNQAAFWGKWGIYNPNVAKEYLRQAYNRGYGQPLITGRDTAFGDTPILTYLARRWRYDWLKLIVMRIDSERIPLTVLKRQIWMARFEYWVRRFYARKAINNAAKVEWAFIKERIKQPMTWTGNDLQHASLWLLNVCKIYLAYSQ